MHLAASAEQLLDRLGELAREKAGLRDEMASPTALLFAEWVIRERRIAAIETEEQGIARQLRGLDVPGLVPLGPLDVGDELPAPDGEATPEEEIAIRELEVPKPWNE